MRFLLLWYFIVFIIAGAKGQSPDSLKSGRQNIFSYGLGLQYGTVFAHSPEVENTSGANPAGIELIFSWQRNDKSTWDLCNCFPRKGLLLAYYDYDNEILGKGAIGSFFLEPLYRIHKNTFFSFKASAGLAWLSNPFDSIKNPDNRSYSTTINMYVGLSLGLWYAISPYWQVNASINYQHTSNGGMRQPNKGINWPTAGASVVYIPQPQTLYTGPRMQGKPWKQKPIRWDLGVYGMARRVLDEKGESSRIPMLGLHFQGSKQVGRIFAITGGAEVNYDWSLKYKLEQDSVDASPVRAGLLGGCEFLLGKFVFSARLGVYLFDQTPYYDAIYHRWGILFRMNKHLGAGLCLQAHRHVAEFIDLRLVYSF